MDVRLEDGTILRNVPEGTTKAQIMERLGKSRVKAIGKPQEPTFAEKYVAPVLDAVGLDKIPEGTVRGLVQGGADPVLGAAQMVLPEGSAPDAAIKRQLEGYEASRGKDAGDFDVSRMVGSAVLSPLAMLTGGVAAAPTALARVGQGVGMGALGGATNPVTSDDFWGDKRSQTAVGATLGGILPAGWETAKLGGRWVRDLVQPSMGKWGANRAAGRLANEVAGSKKGEIIEAMLAARESVPGSAPTAGQAALPARSAEFSALTEIAGRAKPTPTAERLSGQQAARAAAIREIAKTPQELAGAKAARKAAADPLYQAARSGGPVDAKPVMAKIDRLINENPGNKELVTELKTIRNGMIANRKTGELHTDPQKVASVLDGMKAQMADEKNKFILGNLSELKDDLRAVIPGMADADATFAAQSKPVNKMVVGAELEKALTSGTGKERATSFANAVENAQRIPELQRRTGAQRFGAIDEILDPAEMAKVRGVKDEIVRDVDLADLASAGMPKAQRMVGDFEPQKLVNPLERTIMVINSLMSRLAGRGSKKTMDAMAELNMDPKKLAGAMKDATPFERQQIVDAIMRMQAAGTGQAQ